MMLLSDFGMAILGISSTACRNFLLGTGCKVQCLLGTDR